MAERIQRGIDLGGTKVLILDRQGSAESRRQFPTGPQFTPGDLAALLEALPPAVTTGLAAPGIVDATGWIRDCDVLPHFTGWTPPFDAVLNDGEAALVSAMPSMPGNSVTMVVGVGTGIVSALQVNGVRLRTLRPFAGEFGHMPLGRGGSLDALASGAAILKKTNLSADQIHLRLAAQDPTTTSVIQSAGEALGLGIATLIQVIHPSAIGLYGGTFRYPGYRETALQAIAQFTDSALHQQCRVTLLADPETVVARGALAAAGQRS